MSNKLSKINNNFNVFYFKFYIFIIVIDRIALFFLLLCVLCASLFFLCLCLRFADDFSVSGRFLLSFCVHRSKLILLVPFNYLIRSFHDFFSIMSEEILKVIIPQLIENFSPLAKSRGQIYFKEGRTQNLAINFQKMSLTAEVKDDRRPHAVRVHFNMGDDQLSVSQSCTCPTQNSCKHIYAALLAVQNILMQAPSTTESSTATLPLPPPLPPPPSNLSTPLSEWIVKAEQQAKTGVSAETSTIKERQIAWKLIVGEGNKANLSLSMEVVRLLKTGEYARATPQTCCIGDLLRSHSTTAAIRSIMTEEDWRIITLLAQTHCDSVNYSVITFSRLPALVLLKELIATKRCHLEDLYTPPLSWGEERDAAITWELTALGNAQRAACISTEPSVTYFVQGENPFYLDRREGTMGFLQFAAPLSLIKALLSAPAIPHQELATFQEVLNKRLPTLATYAPPTLQKRTIAGKPINYLVLSMRKRGTEQTVVGSLFFEYEKQRLPLGALHEEIVYKTTTTLHKNNGEIITVERATTLERQAVKTLLTDMKWDFHIVQEQGQYRVVFRPPEKGNFLNMLITALSNHKRELERRGWRVEIDDTLPFQSVDKGDNLFLQTTSEEWLQQDWFDLQLGTSINGERVDLMPALLKLLQQEDPLELLEREGMDTPFPLATEDRRLIMVPRDRLHTILKILISKLQGSGVVAEKGHLRVARWSADIVADLKKAEESAELRWIGPDALYTFAERISGQQSLPEIPPPSRLYCTLRSYQREGLNWLQFLRSCRLNGILADDMGLGKTVQALAHLLVEKESGRMNLPSLVVAPTSVIPNWRAETEKFAPSLRVLVLQGMHRYQYFDDINEYDIILTTYPLLMRDNDILLKYKFHLLILDEAQAVKNSDTQAYHAVQQIKARHRLCLTGTPMENHLGELWSLFNFLLPGFLGDKKTFHNTYRKPIEKEGDTERHADLVMRVKPFILRRTKQHVAKELPAKTEIIQRIEMGPRQQDLYEAIRLKTQSDLMRHIEERGLARSQIAVLDALLKLRQVCCDPRLVKAENRTLEADSAKLEFLMETLPQMLEENRKILLFSQFTSMLALIQKELDSRQISYTLLTGDTGDRETPVRRFQEGEVPLMLLSLKAGGVGLNLTAADTVILFDPWWNPAVEEQAADRAHRIGQTKAVFVYKLVTSGTVEEKIVALQERKREMVASLFEGQEGAFLNVTLEDLENMFAPLTLT